MIQSEIAHIIQSQLEHQRLCFLCTAGEQGVRAMPVRYRNSGLTLYCLVPRWADIEFYIEQNPDVLILVSFNSVDALRWIQYSGKAGFDPAAGWKQFSLPGTMEMHRHDLYKVIRVEPKRIDYINEEKGWGARETLEL